MAHLTAMQTVRSVTQAFSRFSMTSVPHTTIEYICTLMSTSRITVVHRLIVTFDLKPGQPSESSSFNPSARPCPIHV